MNEKNKNEFEEEIEYIAEEFETEFDLKVLNECWHISIHSRDIAGVSINNEDMDSRLKKLNEIGNIEHFKTVRKSDKIVSQQENESASYGYEIDLKSEKQKKEIENYLDSFKDNFYIRILAPNSNISDYIDLINDLSDENRKIGDILREIGSLTENELEEVLNIQKELVNENADDQKHKQIGELLIEEKLVHEPVLKAALAKQDNIRKNLDAK